MLQRTRPLRDPVTIYLDDAKVRAERGEPLAVALLAAGKVTLARSPKLHRPRAPSCLRGACDGCLARVDGVPNVMTCLRPATGGEHIETQNVLGSRESDLLRLTDWFFPQGIDHHHLMAGIPGVSGVMQAFARKLAGLGKLPDAKVPPREARRAEVSVLVVGAGLAGHAVASTLASAGVDVLLADDAVAPGGSLSGAPRVAKGMEARYPLARVKVASCSVVAGIYRGEALVAAEDGATVVRAKATVFATGTHDGVLAVPNNDLPGVMSARALAQLAARGVFPKGRTAIVGDGFWADELTSLLPATPRGERPTRIPSADVVSFKGTSRVREVYVRDAKGGRSIPADVVATAVPGAPSFEVAAQAGADVRFDPACGYAVACDERGRAAPSVWATGECTGAPFDPEAIAAQAERVAADVRAALAETA
ncbi:MAG: 2Fe-2S iron-sulfur cluster-binding protein [Polyangiaceae bacterium]